MRSSLSMLVAIIVIWEEEMMMGRGNEGGGWGRAGGVDCRSDLVDVIAVASEEEEGLTVHKVKAHMESTVPWSNRTTLYEALKP